MSTRLQFLTSRPLYFVAVVCFLAAAGSAGFVAIAIGIRHGTVFAGCEPCGVTTSILHRLTCRRMRQQDGPNANSRSHCSDSLSASRRAYDSERVQRGADVL